MEVGYRDHMRTVELDAPLTTVVIGQIVRGDANADRLVLTLKNGGQSAELSGYSADGIFINRLGMEVPIKAQINANVVTAVLGKGCYDVGGAAVGHMRLISSDASQIRTVIRFVADVTRDGSGVAYDPDGVIKDIDTLLAKLTAMENATKDSLAAAQEARDAAAEAAQTAETAGTQAVSLAQAAGVQAISNANTAGAEAKATAETAAAKADAAREAIQGDLGAIEAAILTKAPAIECEASGSILTVPDAAAQPAVQLISHIAPVQAGSGDPSPDNVRPISGWNAATARRAGKNLYGGLYLAEDFAAKIPSAVIDTEAKTVKFTSPAISGVKLFGAFKPNTQYTIILTINAESTGATANIGVGYEDGTFEVIRYKDAAGTKRQVVYITKAGKSVKDVSGANYSGTQYLLYEESGIFEGVLTADDFTPYQGQTLTAALPETVYGGTLDWKTGVLMVDKNVIELSGTTEMELLSTADGVSRWSLAVSVYDGKTPKSSKQPVSSHLKYGRTVYCVVLGSNPRHSVYLPYDVKQDALDWFESEAQKGTPVQILYELKEPYTIQLTPQQLELLKGLNNVWSDTGDTSLVYAADTKMYIDGKISELVTLAIAEN